jgi:hypothetical protein
LNGLMMASIFFIAFRLPAPAWRVRSHAEPTLR